jgi:hypothetical protein
MQGHTQQEYRNQPTRLPIAGRHSLGRVIAKLLKKNRLLEQDGTLSAAVSDDVLR